MNSPQPTRPPGRKLLLAIGVAVALAIPLMLVWFLIYDRESQSHTATVSIAEGWGGKQLLTGPVLVIPYKTTVDETTLEGGKSVTRTRTVDRELSLDPAALDFASDLKPEVRHRSIYEAVVYDSANRGSARFALPPDFARYGVDPASLDLAKAELRFGVHDARGLGPNPSVRLAGRPLSLLPGAGSGARGGGFFAFVDASALRGGSLLVDFQYVLKGNTSLALRPQGGDIHWRVTSAWPHPSLRWPTSSPPPPSSASTPPIPPRCWEAGSAVM